MALGGIYVSGQTYIVLRTQGMRQFLCLCEAIPWQRHSSPEVSWTANRVGRRQLYHSSQPEDTEVPGTICDQLILFALPTYHLG